MRKMIAAAAAVAVVMLASPSLAQPTTGSRLAKPEQRGVELPKRDAAIAAREMAQCLYNRRKGAAEALLHAYHAEAAEAAYRKLGDEVECYRIVSTNDFVDVRRVSFSQDVLRGAIAEAALSRNYDDAVLLQPIAFEQKRYLRPWFAATGRSAVVDEMAACIADTNPRAILTLSRTAPESKTEASAFAALTPSLGQCLAAGATLSATRPALRAALADALYQRVRNPALSLEPVEAAQK